MLGSENRMARYETFVSLSPVELTEVLGRNYSGVHTVGDPHLVQAQALTQSWEERHIARAWRRHTQRRFAIDRVQGVIVQHDPILPPGRDFVTHLREPVNSF